jgi:hypothetical protein
MEMNSKDVPSLGHCFANLFLHGITKQPVHCIGLSHLVRCAQLTSKQHGVQRMARFLVLRGDPGFLYPGNLH